MISNDRSPLNRGENVLILVIFECYIPEQMMRLYMMNGLWMEKEAESLYLCHLNIGNLK